MGRKKHSISHKETLSTLIESAPWAAQHLKEVCTGLSKSTALRVEACKYVIDQVEGRPTQKTILAGDKEAPLQTFIFILADGKQLTARQLLTEGVEEPSQHQSES